MGTFTDLIHQCSGLVTRKVDRSVWDWIWAVSQLADNLTGGTQAQTRYVNKAGSDTTGDGSFDNPFLTIAAAIASITDASATKPYTVQVAPGIYTTAFAFKAWVYVEGIDKSAVYLNPVQANWIDASFAAGAQDAGLSNVTLQTDLAVNFATVASAGAGTFKLRDILLDTGADLSFTGNNVLNVVDLQNIISIGPVSSTLTMANITSNIASGNMRNGVLTITGTDAYAQQHRIESFSTGGAINVTWTGAVTANSLVVTFYSGEPPFTPTSMNISGAGAQVFTRGIVQLAGPDADTTFSFGRIPNGGTVIFPYGADCTILANLPAANRTYTIEGGNAPGTRLRIVNQTAFVMTIAYAAGIAGIAGMPTYVGPFQTVTLYASTSVLWNAAVVVQSGQVTLTNGVSALIPADIVAESRIVAHLKDINGSATTGPVTAAKPADRVVGTRAGGGGFKITGTTNAGVTNAADNGIYDWHVQN